MGLASSAWTVLVQALLWIRGNPVTFLTGLMALVTAYYAKSTTKYVEIVKNQLAAQIAPEIAISLIGDRWQADEFCGIVVIAASKNTLVLNGGDILLRCEHGSIRVAAKLSEWTGHSLRDSENLQIPVRVPFQHHGARSHSKEPTIECSVAYRDARNVAAYRCEMLTGGVVKRVEQPNLGEVRLWLGLKLRALSWQLMLWQVKQRMRQTARELAKQRSLAVDQAGGSGLSDKKSARRGLAPTTSAARVAQLVRPEARVAKILDNASRMVLWIRDHLR